MEIESKHSGKAFVSHAETSLKFGISIATVLDLVSLRHDEKLWHPHIPQYEINLLRVAEGHAP
jgi:hypothetical protein